MAEFPKRFDYREAEPRLYQRWLDANAFQSAYAPDGTLRDPKKKDAKPFVIVIPPPNITGRLHMGHALNNTVQDVLIRYHRMDGWDALWVPGTDHAGIATQTVVKKQLDAEGIDFRALGRDEVVRRIWQWKEKYGDAIIHQLKRMGCSCDWSRTRFTMDDGLSLAVRESFVRLYREGLVYRGKRIVNWCPVDRTALSDDEVEQETEKGKMYHIRYPFQDDPSKYVVVATTRPETLFGDVAVAVNAKDERWSAYIGKNVVLPLQGRVIPVIADEHADPEKGTGVVKITPAHDPNDFEVGLRHNLAPIDVMHDDATMNDVVPERYRGLDRYKARAKALAELEELGLLEAVKDHELAIGRSYRSKVPIEYRLSDQWFVKMGPLAAKALEASGYVNEGDAWVKKSEGGLHFHPDRFEKVYHHWLAGIRDWCISRQIWWGHRIPAWIHVETGEIAVDLETPELVKRDPSKWRQEDDVLDTWFSSWLWPMSTLGWPQDTPDYRRYYPTSVLSTAKDIIFFWVARMNFAGIHFDGRLPYRDVYMHSTIADERGVTMSKSKGNGIDPLTIIDGATTEQLKQPVLDARPSNMKELINAIEKNFPNGFEAVGTDAMRWTLITSITDGENVKLSLPRFTDGRNFITKLWNGAGRVLTTLEADVERGIGADAPIAPETDEDRWLLARLDSTITRVRGGLDGFDFGAMAQELYHFVWDDFCSWALELSKTRLSSEDVTVRRGVLRVMGTVLADTLRLLHPVIPFVTEELWSRLVPAMTKLGLWLDGAPESSLLILAEFPRARRPLDRAIEERFAILQRFVMSARQLRAASNIKDNMKVVVGVKPLVPETRQMLEQAKDSVCFLAKLESIEWSEARGKGMAAQYDPAFELYLDLGRYIDLKVELERLDKEIAKTEKDLAATEKTLSNPDFAARAPAEKVEAANARKAELTERLGKLAATKAELAGLVA
ncbi:valine--tRNA ligase [Myxococcota bacterium]|nr:valine--tRNA ligase [Myxococcota bacterium]